MKVSTIVTLAFATAASAAQFRITATSGDWLKTFPTSDNTPSVVLLDDHFASVYERWAIEGSGERYTVRNIGTGHYISCSGESCVATKEPMAFSISSAGDGFYFVTDEVKGFTWSKAGDHLGFSEFDPNNKFKFEPVHN